MANNVEYILSLKDLFTPKMQSAISETEKLDKAMGKVNATSEALSGIGKRLAGAFSLAAIGAYGLKVIETTANFQRLSSSIRFASDNSAQGEMSMAWIKDMSNKYGLPVNDVADGFKTLQGALMNTAFSSSKVRQMFEQVNTGVVAMGLTGEDAKGVFLALGQVMSKGKVQAEELRGQIGERIPGAFKIAANAMGMTTQELDKFMSEGKLIAEEFLPKFAKEMEKTFANGAKIDNVSTSVSRLGTAWESLMLSFGNSNDGVIKKTIDGLSRLINLASDYVAGTDALQKQAAGVKANANIGGIEEYFTKRIEVLQKQGLSSKKIEGIVEGELNAKYDYAHKLYIKQSNMAAIFEQKARDAALSHDTKKEIEYSRNSVKLKEASHANMLIRDAILGDNGIGGLTEKLTNKLYVPKTSLLGANSATDITKKTSTSSGLDSKANQVSGSKPTSIVINVGKLVETQNFHGAVENMKNLAPNVRDEMIKIFLSMLNDSQQLAAV